MRKQSQNTVSFEVSKAIIDLLESVHVRNHYREGRIITLTACQLAIQLQEQGARIWQTCEVVGGGRTFGLLVFEGILNRQCHFGTNG